METVSSPRPEEGKIALQSPPCVMVIFGATGDLTSRKLFPALYHLVKEGKLSENFVCVGFARRKRAMNSFEKK